MNNNERQEKLKKYRTVIKKYRTVMKTPTTGYKHTPVVPNRVKATGTSCGRNYISFSHVNWEINSLAAGDNGGKNTH